MSTRLFGDGNNKNHYRVVGQMQLVALQAANSRLFTVRNPSTTKVLLIERAVVTIIQNNNFTAALIAQVVSRKLTGYTAVDTVNASTPVATEKKTGMVTAPGVAVLRALTFAGNSAGMTGGTIGASGGLYGITPLWMLTTLPTAGPVPRAQTEATRANDPYPLLLGTDEGLSFENNVLLGAAAGALVSIELEWSEIDPV